MGPIDTLKKGMEEYGIQYNNVIIEKFKIYIATLLEWNKKVNLTAVTDEYEIVIKHFLDSLSCMQCGVDFSKSKVIDVGTGAGFPGVPLKIVMNGMKLTLLDSLNKRVVFLNELKERLGIECEVIHGRAEEYGVKSGYRENYDIVLSRAVASMNILVEYTLPFVKVGGYLLCQKGPSLDEELEQSNNAIVTLGGKVMEVVNTRICGSNLDHRILKIKKMAICPGKYPRKAGTAEKKPIM